MADSDLQMKAERGLTACQIELGHNYMTGEAEFPVDYGLARKWLTLAADKGAHTAQFLLARLHEDGLGGKRNIEKAIELYQEAANAGGFFACVHLARIFARGTSVRRSVEKGRFWYRKVLRAESSLDDSLRNEVDEAKKYLEETGGDSS